MASPLWSDSGTWIALGATALSVGVGVAMSVVFRRILRQPPPPTPETTADPKGAKNHE